MSTLPLSQCKNRKHHFNRLTICCPTDFPNRKKRVHTKIDENQFYFRVSIRSFQFFPFTNEITAVFLEKNMSLVKVDVKNLGMGKSGLTDHSSVFILKLCFHLEVNMQGLHISLYLKYL